MLRPRRIAPNIEMFAALTPTLAPATHTNSYALGGRDVVVVEPATPFDDERREWLAWVQGLRSQGRRLVAIVATHHHPDHVGGAEFFARELQVPVWAHPKTAERIDCKVHRMISDGEEVVLSDVGGNDAWHVLHTPGHAPGHICLYHPTTGALVVGDMVASVGTILIAPGDGDLAEYIVQLERLGRLEAAWALPAHGDPIAEPTTTFARYVSHRLAREAKILAALRSVPDATSEELVRLAYDDVPESVWPIARLSVEAHLEKLLLSDGRIARAERNDAFVFVR